MKRFVTLFLLTFVLQSAFSAEKYYMAIFSYQDGANTISNSHSFASFSRVHIDEALNRATLIEEKTISWGPATGVVRLFHRPEIGRNSSLRESIESGLHRGLRVSEWGPYEVAPGIYQRAAQKVAELQSGRILYKVLDKKFRPYVASNCFHAIADIDMSYGMAVYGTMRGDAASYRTLQHLSRWVLNWQRQSWVNQLLGIDQYFIQYR